MRRWQMIGIGASLLVVAVGAIALVLGSRTDDATSAETAWTDVGPEQLSEMLAGRDRFVVNVHVPYEGEIAGTDAFIPYDEIGGRLDELPPDRNAEIVLYCRSGRMSLEAARTLVARGYTNVYNLVGGFEGWEAAGYKLVQSDVAPGS